MGKRELVALLNLSSWCFVMVERLFLAVPWGCLRFVIVVFPDHNHLLFLHSVDHTFVKAYICYRLTSVAVILVNPEFSLLNVLFPSNYREMNG